jgi:hypothetical protein
VTSDLARRRSLLAATLGLPSLTRAGKPAPPEVLTVRTWLDVTGMPRQDYDLS